jgi:6-phosphogluconate dehydrogenase
MHGMQDNELLDTFYNGLTEISSSYIDSIASNIFRNKTIEEAKGLLDMMVENYNNQTLNEEDNFKAIPKERGVLTLSDEVMKEALIVIEEKKIKSIDLLKNFLREVLNFY